MIHLLKWIKFVLFFNTIKPFKLYFQKTIVLYNYELRFNLHLIKTKKQKSHPKRILYSTFWRSWILSPSCPNQSYLNAPKGIITTFQFINMNFPGGLNWTIVVYIGTTSVCLDTEMLKSTSSQTVFSHTHSTHSNRGLARGHDSERRIIWSYFTPLNNDKAKRDIYQRLIGFVLFDLL